MDECREVMDEITDVRPCTISLQVSELLKQRQNVCASVQRRLTEQECCIGNLYESDSKFFDKLILQLRNEDFVWEGLDEITKKRIDRILQTDRNGIFAHFLARLLESERVLHDYEMAVSDSLIRKDEKWEIFKTVRSLIEDAVERIFLKFRDYREAEKVYDRLSPSLIEAEEDFVSKNNLWESDMERLAFRKQDLSDTIFRRQCKLVLDDILDYLGWDRDVLELYTRPLDGQEAVLNSEGNSQTLN